MFILPPQIFHGLTLVVVFFLALIVAVIQFLRPVLSFSLLSGHHNTSILNKNYVLSLLILSVGGVVVQVLPKPKQRKRKQRSPNHTSYRASVKTLCWYSNYLEPGQVRETTHELSRFDRYDKCCHWFCMPLCKLEELTTLPVLRSFICEPMIYWRMLEFRKCVELLVMSLLYILGHGASFRSLRPLCHMSKSNCTNFSHVLLDATNGMCDEFICMPKKCN